MTRQPNFLIIMSDEHGPMWSSAYGHPFVRTPNMERLADRGATFDAAYCNAPLCVPSRLSFLTGRYVSNCGGWDNTTPLPSDAPTWPYALRKAGYDAVLCGKMHLLGHDNRHGFSDQLAYEPHGGGNMDPEAVRRRDADRPLERSVRNLHPIYKWDDGIQAGDLPWPEVRNAGAGRQRMIEADDTIEAAALEYLRDPARTQQPFALCVGFVAPHFPFIVPEPYFSMYYPEHTDLPNNPPGHIEDLPAAAVRLRRMLRFDGYTDDEMRRARAAYYGLITYLDDKIGRLLNELEERGLADNTVIVHTSDHGESLGEHGLWRKMNFYEQAARVPLQISWPGHILGGQRFSGAVSTVDTTATILDIAGVAEESADYLRSDGDSLLPMMSGATTDWKDEAFVEHLAHGTDRARAMVRQGNMKLSYSHGSPPEIELYNLDSDPGEFTNLAGHPDHQEAQERLVARVMEIWGDPDRLTQEIAVGQRARLMIREVQGDNAVF